MVGVDSEVDEVPVIVLEGRGLDVPGDVLDVRV